MEPGNSHSGRQSEPGYGLMRQGRAGFRKIRRRGLFGEARPEKRGLCNWRRLVVYMTFVMGLVVAAVVFVVLYRQEVKEWNHKWKIKCKHQAHIVTKNFETNIKLVKILAVVVQMFALNMSPPALNQSMFELLAKDTLAASFGLSQSLVAMRMIFESQRAAFEKEMGWEITDGNGERRTPQETYVVSILGYNPFYPEHIDWYSLPGFREEIQRGVDSGDFSMKEPQPEPGDTTGHKFGVLYGIAIYERDMPPNATVEERQRLFRGGMAGYTSMATLMERSLAEANDNGNHVVKLVDVSHGLKPMYIHDIELASGREWTYIDFVHHEPVTFGDVSRRYELWCSPAPGEKMIPTRAIAWAVAVVAMAFIAAHVLWSYVISIERAETDCKNALLLAEKMNEAKMEAERHSATKSTFLTSVSHEIRTPMNGVLGMLGLLLDTTTLTSVQRDYAETALSSGTSLLSLVNDVLDLSKIEAGLMDLQNIPFVVGEEMDAILSMFGENCRGKGIEIAALSPEAAPQTVMGDPMRFRQVINNLVDNAVKFCKGGHVFIRILAIPEDHRLPSLLDKFHAGNYFAEEVSKAQQPLETLMCQTLSGQAVADGDCCWTSILSTASQNDALLFPPDLSLPPFIRLLVWVEDSGIGMSDSEKERIFIPFEQADRGDTRKYGGAGIGLNVVKKLADLMSGRVTFSSRAGAGTTFRFDMRVGYPPQQIMYREASANDATLHDDSRPAPRIPNPPALINRMPTIPERAAPRVSARNHTKGIHALCLDNNGVRAQVTLHYLRRSGISAEVAALRSDDLWRGGGQLGARWRAAGGGVKDRVHVAFVELFPGGGVWGSASRPSSSRAPGGEGGELKWNLEYLRRLCASTRAVDERLREDGVAVPLVLLANDADPKLGDVAKLAGFAGVVTKPLRCSSIVASLREVLDASKQKTIQDAQATRCQGLNLLKGKKALVVDDNAINLKIAGKMLEKHGVRVTCKPGGEEAVKAVEGDHDFDIIFMDIQMPGMDGHEATRAIREMEMKGISSGPFVHLNRKRCPILALTANAIKGAWEECKESGMDGFMTKPIEERRLVQLASEFLLPAELEIECHD